ncbi:MAG: hypothetical protein HQK56_20955 [Deltaproteobacteria bacterium]|nr:hypothetical protein [Deltaproteobacteria bacterium]
MTSTGTGSTTGNGILLFPCFGKYFKAYISATTSGTVTLSAVLRNTSISQFGLAGAIGVGVAPSQNPLYVAGKDNTGLTRPLTLDTAGNTYVRGGETPGTVPSITTSLGVGGVDQMGVSRRLALDSFGAQRIHGIEATIDTDNIPETLTRVLLELRQVNFWMRQLPLYLNYGIVITEEEAAFRDDPTLPNS